MFWFMKSVILIMDKTEMQDTMGFVIFSGQVSDTQALILSVDFPNFNTGGFIYGLTNFSISGTDKIVFESSIGSTT